MKSLSKQCDICSDKIGLYQPWYTIRVKGYLAFTDLKKNPMCLCPNCFHAYKDFLIERETEMVHQKHYEEIKNA